MFKRYISRFKSHFRNKKLPSSGLGAEGRGRADPILDAGQTDKIGIGSRPAKIDPSDAFGQFRQQRSSTYKSRWD